MAMTRAKRNRKRAKRERERMRLEKLGCVGPAQKESDYGSTRQRLLSEQSRINEEMGRAAFAARNSSRW